MTIFLLATPTYLMPNNHGRDNLSRLSLRLKIQESASEARFQRTIASKSHPAPPYPRSPPGQIAVASLTFILLSLSIGLCHFGHSFLDLGCRAITVCNQSKEKSSNLVSSSYLQPYRPSLMESFHSNPQRLSGTVPSLLATDPAIVSAAGRNIQSTTPLRFWTCMPTSTT